MDFYLSDINCIDRLLDEYNKYGRLIVAYDFDNTVFDYNSKGITFKDVINLLHRCHQAGFHLIVFTSCDESRFDDIRKYLKDNHIPFDAINETPEFIPFKGRKVYYNVLLDDRAGLKSAYVQLSAVVDKVAGLQNEKKLQTTEEIA